MAAKDLRAIDDIRRRHKEAIAFGTIGRDRCQFDIGYLLSYIDQMQLNHSQALVKALRNKAEAVKAARK